MNKKACKIHIIGAGVSGLIAARVLEDHGYCPVIIEASDRVGGRVKTDLVHGFQLDHGFQVLLTAYPAAKKYLDFDALELQKLLPGASIFKNKKQKIIGDPLKEISLLFSTLFSGIGSFSDKLKILQLNSRLKKKSISAIFSDKEQDSLSYLMDFGFSNEMIADFFKPFFSGIFLEKKLETSSRMLAFIYKMFGEGYAAIPKSGIEAIPKQLLQKLNATTFKFNTKVTSLKDGVLTLEGGSLIESDFTIVATDATDLIPNLKKQAIEWKSCHTLYFETSKRKIKKPIIGLVPDHEALINNIFYHTSLDTASQPKKELLSVTVIDHQNLTEEVLVGLVIKELKQYCAIDSVKFIKHYFISKALPILNDLKYEILPADTRVTNRLFLAGDTQLNGSLNTAILSGERAAMGVIEALLSKNMTS
jgi:protoporphyrinogen oxidase